MADWPSPVLAFPLAFAALWLGVLHLLSVIGGWRSLASRYAADARPEGERFMFQSGQLGWVRYGNCLRITAGPSGLGLAVFLPFRPGHRPVFVPWPDVRVASERRLFFERVKLTFVKAPGVVLRLSRRLAVKLARASGGALSLPEAA